jgi:hypothetical protein
MKRTKQSKVNASKFYHVLSTEYITQEEIEANERVLRVRKDELEQRGGRGGGRQPDEHAQTFGARGQLDIEDGVP